MGGLLVANGDISVDLEKSMVRYQKNIIIILLKIQRMIDIHWTTSGNKGKKTMPFTKVDQKGRMMLPSEIRRKMGISPGDEFVVDELGPDTILLKKVDVRAMIRDAILTRTFLLLP